MATERLCPAEITGQPAAGALGERPNQGGLKVLAVFTERYGTVVPVEGKPGFYRRATPLRSTPRGA